MLLQYHSVSLLQLHVSLSCCQKTRIHTLHCCNANYFYVQGLVNRFDIFTSSYKFRYEHRLISPYIYLCNTSFIVYVRLMMAICLMQVQQSFYGRVQRWQQTGSRRKQTLVNENIGIKFSQHDPFLESYNGQSIALTTRTQRSLYVIQK